MALDYFGNPIPEAALKLLPEGHQGGAVTQDGYPIAYMDGALYRQDDNGFTKLTPSARGMPVVYQGRVYSGLDLAENFEGGPSTFTVGHEQPGWTRSFTFNGAPEFRNGAWYIPDDAQVANASPTSKDGFFSGGLTGILNNAAEIAPVVGAGIGLGIGATGAFGALGAGSASGALGNATLAAAQGGNPVTSLGTSLIGAGLNTTGLDAVSRGALTGAAGSALNGGDLKTGALFGAAGGALGGKGSTSRSAPLQYADASKYTGTMTDAPVYDTPAGGEMDYYDPYGGDWFNGDWAAESAGGALQNVPDGDWWRGAPSSTGGLDFNARGTGGLDVNARYTPGGGLVPTATDAAAFDSGFNLNYGGALPFDPGQVIPMTTGADVFNQGIDLANDEYTSEQKNYLKSALGLGKPLLKSLGMLNADDSVNLPKLLAGAGIVGGLLEGRQAKNTTQTTQLPEWYTQGSKEALALAKKYAETPWEGYSGERVAPLSGNENQAIEMARTSAGRYEPMVDEAGNLIREGSRGVTREDIGALVNPAFADMMQPSKVSAMYDEAGNLIRSGALPISRGEIDGYFNPYVEKALDPVARRLNEEAARRDIERRAQAGMKGAFGGSRDVLDRNLIEQNRLQGVSDLYGTGYARAFDTALNAAQGDKGRKISAGGALTSTANSYGGTAARAWEDATGVATGNRNRAITAGGALGTTARTGSELTDASVRRLGATGALDRGVTQAGRDFSYEQYQDRLKQPTRQIDAYAGALRGNPGSTTTRTDPPPSLLGQAAGALGAYNSWFSDDKRK